MRRVLLIPVAAAVLLAAPAVRADDTPKAANARKLLKTKIEVDFKETELKAIMEEIKEKAPGLSIKVDTAGGVSMNLKLTYKAKDKPVEEVLGEMFDKVGLGYYVRSQQGTAYDGQVVIKQGKERGYLAGEEPGKAPAKAAEPKPGAKPAAKPPAKPMPPGKKEEEPEAKPEPKGKPEEEPKPEPKEDPAAKPKAESKELPPLAGEAAENEAARRLKQAQEVIAAKKMLRAKARLQEIINTYPTTKAAEEARKLLRELK